jgi:hypothetical protein
MHKRSAKAVQTVCRRRADCVEGSRYDHQASKTIADTGQSKTLSGSSNTSARPNAELHAGKPVKALPVNGRLAALRNVALLAPRSRWRVAKTRAHVLSVTCRSWLRVCPTPSRSRGVIGRLMAAARRPAARDALRSRVRRFHGRAEPDDL